MLALRRFAAFSILFLFAAPMAFQNVSGDGMSYGYRPDTSTWWLLDEDAQFAIINYHAPNESLLLQASISAADIQTASKMVWLFPIPTSPENATIGIYRSFPGFGGQYLRDHAKRSIENDFLWMYSSQIYMLPLAASTYVTTFGSSAGHVMLPKASLGGRAPNVDVFQRVEHYGMSTELVSASSASALEDYLSYYGIELPPSSSPVIQDYLGMGYSFVASHVSNVSQFVQNSTQGRGFSGSVYSLSVMVTFTTSKIFFPLRLSSIYGSAEIPIVLEIVDYVTPVPFESATSNLAMDTEYLFQPKYGVSSDVVSFFKEQSSRGQLRNGVLSDLEYTLVIIDEDAQDLTEDLWLEDHAPADVEKLSFVREFSFAIAIPIFIGLSMLSSLLAGSYVYRAYNPRRSRFALLGLANAASILGLFLVARWLRIDETFVRLSKPEPLFKLKAYVAVFSILFVVLGIFCLEIMSSLLL
jgi:hypothetical protein